MGKKRSRISAFRRKTNLEIIWVSSFDRTKALSNMSLLASVFRAATMGPANTFLNYAKDSNTLGFTKLTQA